MNYLKFNLKEKINRQSFGTFEKKILLQIEFEIKNSGLRLLGYFIIRFLFTKEDFIFNESHHIK